MRLNPGESKYARYLSETSEALQVNLDGQWHDLTPGVEDPATGVWTASPSGSVHAILLAHADADPVPAGAVPLEPGVHHTLLRRSGGGEMLVDPTGPIYVLGVAGWPVDWANLKPDDADPQDVSLAEELAVLTMQVLTVDRVGMSLAAVSPTSTSCRHIGQRWNPHWHDGAFVNVCACMRDCSCPGGSTATLPGPVGQVMSVEVDGVELDPSAYRLLDGGRLQRTDGLLWPSCDPDGFTVVYQAGYPVDRLGARAAGILASEYLKAIGGSGECRLPTSVTSIVRQGISMQMETGLFPGGMTGITEVDVYVRRWNPYALVAAPTVWSPDIESAQVVRR